MAQRLILEEKRFLFGSRLRAMSAVMTLTKGKLAFLFNTFEKVIN